MFSSKKDNPRLLLAKLRKADYTHAGDEEAIDIFLEKINKLFAARNSIAPLNAFDAGCGLGGTANYIRKKTSLNLWNRYRYACNPTCQTILSRNKIIRMRHNAGR